jgi:hypothetical protein
MVREFTGVIEKEETGILAMWKSFQGSTPKDGL